MQHYWFKPKRYGLGAAPSSWQGWIITLIYCAAVMAIGIWFGSDKTVIDERMAPSAIIVIALTIIFIGIAWRTSEGGFRWRWGDDK